jgi:signal transduction histidine kinase/CheY-like chemotaxis protein
LQDKTAERQNAADREQLLQREQAARETAETANRIKDEFLAVLSHELRSPLNPILGWAKLLRSGRLDATKTEQALNTIERNALLQSELIEDLLDVSRILRGKLTLNVSPVNLAVVIRGAMETVRLAADAKAIAIEADMVETASISGDSTRLQQVVWNLLSNAVKFTPAGGRVKVRLTADGVTDGADRINDSSVSSVPKSVAQITITDTGKGIAPDFLPQVFDYCQQEDGTTTRKFGGLGLGLAIVRQIVELHGGTVWASSPGEGLGATFTVKLPFLKTEGRGQKAKGGLDSSFALHPSSLPLNGLQILVVDDETDSRDFIAFVVADAGARVRTATSGAEAIALMMQSQLDVLLSDVGMPDMDGYMLMRQVRGLSSEQNGQVRAIALTAYAGDFNQQQALQAGFQRHIAKPVEPNQLVEAIVTLIGNGKTNN